MLNNREAFKVGFLSRCVEEGLSPEQMHQRVKLALDKLAGLTDLPGKALDLAKPVLGAAANIGIPALLAAPPIAGGLAGFGLAKMTDIDDTDVNEIKRRELISELQRQTAHVNRVKMVRDYQRKRQQTGRVFL